MTCPLPRLPARYQIFPLKNSYPLVNLVVWNIIEYTVHVIPVIGARVLSILGKSKSINRCTHHEKVRSSHSMELLDSLPILDWEESIQNGEDTGKCF